MDDNNVVYDEKNVTIEVERDFMGTKTMKELVFEWIRKKAETERLPAKKEDSVY